MSTTDQDAAEFGIHIHQGGWRLGLLVARSVEANAGTGKASGTHVPLDGKVSANAFAKMSGTSHPRVMRYLTAWESAAKKGFVPHAETLSPGVDIDLEWTSLPDWAAIFKARDESKEPDEEEPKSRGEEQITDEQVVLHGKYLLRAIMAQEDGRYQPGAAAALILASVRPVVDWDSELVSLGGSD